MSFEKGEKVRVVRFHDEMLLGAEAIIEEVDHEWERPYGLKFLDEDAQEDFGEYLFADEQLEPVKEEEKTTYIERALLIQDVEDSKVTRRASLLELNTGTMRLHMTTSVADDLIDYINLLKPQIIIFEIHDYDFRGNLIKGINNSEFGFKVDETTGEVIYDK